MPIWRLKPTWPAFSNGKSLGRRFIRLPPLVHLRANLGVWSRSFLSLQSPISQFSSSPIPKSPCPTVPHPYEPTVSTLMNLRQLFQHSLSSPPAPAAHMTWASRTLSGTVAKTGHFLKRQLWAWPIIAVTLLLAIGWGVHGAIERTMQANLRSQLETLRDVEVAMLRTWLAGHRQNAASVAGDAEVRQLTVSLLAARTDEKSQPDDPKVLARQLAKQLGPSMSAHDYDSFFIATRETVVAAQRPEAIGMEVPEIFHRALARVLDGQTAVMAPFPSVLPQRDQSGKNRTGVPMMGVLAPIVDENLQPVAVLGLLIRPEREFTRILQLGRLGQSGETYAFNRDGLLLSNSRFDNDLILLGLLPDV